MNNVLWKEAVVAWPRFNSCVRQDGLEGKINNIRGISGVPTDIRTDWLVNVSLRSYCYTGESRDTDWSEWVGEWQSEPAE
jgi:hypothetical protein